MIRSNERKLFRGERAWKAVRTLCVALLCLMFIINYKAINGWLGSVVSLFAPIIWGLVIAYLLNPFFRFFERKVFYRVHPMSLRRALSLICSYIIFLLFLALIILLIIPQFYDSISNFINNYNIYLTSAVTQYNNTIAWIAGLCDRIGIEHEFLKFTSVETINQSITGLLQNLEGLTKFFDSSLLFNTSNSIFGMVSNIFTNIFTTAFDIICAFFISLYMLSSKEKRYAQIMRLRRALLTDSANAKITSFLEVTDRSFGGFLEGKIIDSLIIGVLTYFVVLIVRIPYPMLMAAIVGITNIIPVIGPVLGAVPTSIIILLTEPRKFIPFLIIVLIIQQIDGNIIGPKILGNNTGVSSLCVLISITVMGKIWGLIGMLLGVPIFATVLELTDREMERRLRKKGISAATENFYPVSSMVDPAKDVSTNTDKTLKMFEKKVLKMQKKLDIGENLTRLEKILYSIYFFARKIKLFPEMSDEVLSAFATESESKAAADAAKQQLKQILSASPDSEQQTE